MAKRRIKKQKIKAQTRQQSLEIEFKPEKTFNKLEKKKATAIEDRTDKNLIIKDLVKTGVISLVLLALLIGAYFYLN